MPGHTTGRESLYRHRLPWSQVAKNDSPYKWTHGLADLSVAAMDAVLSVAHSAGMKPISMQSHPIGFSAVRSCPPCKYWWVCAIMCSLIYSSRANASRNTESSIMYGGTLFFTTRLVHFKKESSHESRILASKWSQMLTPFFFISSSELSNQRIHGTIALFQMSRPLL